MDKGHAHRGGDVFASLRILTSDDERCAPATVLELEVRWRGVFQEKLGQFEG